MGPIFAAAVVAALVAVHRYITALGRRIDANIAAAAGAPAAPAAARAASVGMVLRHSERELQRRSRALIHEIELFLASQDC